MNLYWLESFDHSEDWFVVATNTVEAINYFVNEMGFDNEDDEISALLVCEKKDIKDTPVHFANEEDILNFGGQQLMFDDLDLLRFLDKDKLDMLGARTRVVKIEGVIFVEGNIARACINNA